MLAARSGWAVALLVCSCGTASNAGDAARPEAGASGAAGTSSTSGSGGAAGTSSTSGSGGAAGTSSAAGAAGTSGAAGAALDGGAGGLAATPTYEQRAPLLVARQEHGVAALNGEVYLVGGYTPDLTSSMQVYNPGSDSWRSAAAFPDVLHHPNVAVVDGILYVTGFHTAGGRRVADGRAFAYDPAADRWTARASLPPGTERGASCVTTLGRKIYVFGGTNDATLPYASAYDPTLDSWELLPQMPALRQHCLAAAIDGKIYIVSGRNVGIEGLEPGSWVYDPDARTYAERASIPTPRGGAAGGTLGGRIFVFGGEGNAADPRGVFHQAEAYDPKTDSWASLPDMLIPRHGLGGAVIGDRIYMPGGSTSQGVDVSAANTVFFFQPTR